MYPFDHLDGLFTSRTAEGSHGIEFGDCLVRSVQHEISLCPEEPGLLHKTAIRCLANSKREML